MRIDSDKLRKKSDREGLINDPFRADYRMLVGTKLMTRRLTITDNFSMAAILNADQFLNIPDFKSAEKAFQEISMIADKIETHGEIYIQTRMPDNYLYRYVKNYSYGAFSKEEMKKSLLNSMESEKLVNQIAWYVYESNDLNKLFFDDFLKMINPKQIKIKFIKKSKAKVPKDILSQLKDIYPYSDFSTSSCQMMFSKIN